MRNSSPEYRDARAKVVTAAERAVKHAKPGGFALSPYRVPCFVFNDLDEAVREFLVIEEREIADDHVREIVRDELTKAHQA